jgi:phosphoribosylaminoimidazole-succinocarboxamide synthase
MSTQEKLYEGKAKILYPTDNPEILLTYFKDDATAFNALKRGQIQGKGEVNCSVSAVLLSYLASVGIPTHFVEKISNLEMLVKAVKIIPVEVVVRNIAAGSLCKQTGLAEGYVLPHPLVEFYLKDDALGDPLLTYERLMLLNIVNDAQLNEIKNLTLQINQHLQKFFQNCNITLVDFKLEFGWDKDDNIILADEISPDTCRLWDNQEQDPQAKIMDKDRFRRDLGDVALAYQKVQERVLAQKCN